MKTDDAPSAPGSSTPVHQHSPAQSAISAFLDAHANVVPRSRGARLLGRSPLGTESLHWFWGAVGELDIAEALERLGSDWNVLHCVPMSSGTGASDDRIDHLVIGPPGVFTVKTRNHARQNVWVVRRAFSVDGHSLQYIRSAEVEVGYVERVLGAAATMPLAVSALIAVIDPSSLSIRDLPRDVFVLNARGLLRWLEARDRQLEPEQIEHLAAIAATASTWSGPMGTDARDSVVDRAIQRAAFDSIRREVASARVVRSVWAVAAAAVVTGAMIVTSILTLAPVIG